MVGLCDCNNFFVSCERLFRPDLNGRPVVVLSNNDGCIVARSNEVKALGIKMGTPLFQVKELVDNHNIRVFSSNYQLYGDISKRVMSILRDYLPSIEVYSIDEAFLDYRGFDKERILPHARALSKYLFKATGIPVSIGVAPTKTLAKIASKLCKKYPKLEGACFMYREEDIIKVLKKTPINDIWGIGRKYSKMLLQYSVNSAFDFYEKPVSWVEKMMGICGVRTWKELHSIPSISYDDQLLDKQSICVSRSFTSEIYSYDELSEALSNFASTAALKLRKQNSCTSEITTFILTNYHKASAPQRLVSDVQKLEVATDSTLEIVEIVHKSLSRLFMKGYGFKKGGVIFRDIINKRSVQQSFFDTVDREKHQKLMSAVDAINAKDGRNMVMPASASNNLHISRNHLSPLYTTSWDSILEIEV